MINRVTDNIKYNMITNSMFNIQGQYAQIMEKLSTQKNINRPSDDPIGTNSILDYRTALASIEQYQSNITDANSWLNLTETNIAGLRNIVDEALAIAVSESGASGSAETRATALATLNSMIDEALSLLNAKSGDNYIFGGSVTDMEPFSIHYAPDRISDVSANSANVFDGTVTSGGHYTGTTNKNYAVRIVTTGDIVTAQYQVSSDGGTTWGATQDLPAKVVKANTSLSTQGEPVSAGTVWNRIDNARVQDGTVIAISGTDHAGNAVTGSYTINDSLTDTMQGLLTQIQAAFGASASAGIDSSGRITVTDTTTGSSAMAMTLTVTNPTGGALNFGAITQTTNTTISAGDGISMNFEAGSTNLTSGDRFDVSGYAAGVVGDASASTSNTYSGTVTSSGTYTGAENKNYVVKIVTAGAVGTATYKVSADGGKTWGAVSTTASTVTVGDGMQLTFTGGGSFAVNDAFTVNGYASGYYRGNDDKLNAVIGKNHNMAYNITGTEAFTGQFAQAYVMDQSAAITTDDSITLKKGSNGLWAITTKTGYPNMTITSQTANNIAIDADNNGTNDISIDLTGTWSQDQSIELSVTAGTTSGEIQTSFSGTDSIDLLSTLNALKSALSVTDQDRAMSLIYTQIENLQKVETQMLQYETQAGARMQSMEVTQNNHNSMDLQITNMLADTENADLTKIITEFQMKQIAMQASYNMASQIGKLTIIDYL